MDKKFLAGELEMHEFLLSGTLGRAFGGEKAEQLTQQVRETLHLHRFNVFYWLRLNGTKIPDELMADAAHPPVGQQLPDQPVPGAVPDVAPAAAAPVALDAPKPAAAPCLNFYWVSFESGSAGCVQAVDMAAANERVAVIGVPQSVKILPYAAKPYLFPDDMQGVPDLCYQPNVCAGSSACPNARACSE